jgi:hypothetical protein
MLTASTLVRPDRKARRRGEKLESGSHQTDRKRRAGRLVIKKGETGRRWWCRGRGQGAQGGAIRFWRPGSGCARAHVGRRLEFTWQTKAEGKTVGRLAYTVIHNVYAISQIAKDKNPEGGWSTVRTCTRCQPKWPLTVTWVAHSIGELLYPGTGRWLSLTDSTQPQTTTTTRTDLTTD